MRRRQPKRRRPSRRRRSRRQQRLQRPEASARPSVRAPVQARAKLHSGSDYDALVGRARARRRLVNVGSTGLWAAVRFMPRTHLSEDDGLVESVRKGCAALSDRQHTHVRRYEDTTRRTPDTEMQASVQDDARAGAWCLRRRLCAEAVGMCRAGGRAARALTRSTPR